MGDIKLMQRADCGLGVKIERILYILEKRVTPLSLDCPTVS